MKYAKLATEKEMHDVLTKINIQKENSQNGIPIMGDKNHLYVDASDNHTLLIGSVGSGKTQSVILPFIRTSILAKESMVINDKNGEMYKRLANKMLEEGYKTYVFNFEAPTFSSYFNPLEAAFKLYQEKNVDEAYQLIENLGYALFRDEKEVDPFWSNTATDFFKGLTLYLFTKAKLEEINLNSIHQLAISLKDDKKASEFIKRFEPSSAIYLLLVGTLLAPFDTRASIISVFSNKIKEFLARGDLAKLLANSEFSLLDILKEKFVIFINGTESHHSEVLTSILIEQIYYLEKYLQLKRKVNIILDDFDELAPIRNFAKMLNSSRSLGLRFLCVIKSYTDLESLYSDYTEILKMCFGNLIFLRSLDLKTMDEISRLCGLKEQHEPLISVEELKRLRVFEAVILLPRRLPFKGCLLPDYKIDWGYETKEALLEKRELKAIKIYQED